jgi:hypothetical protein
MHRSCSKVGLTYLYILAQVIARALIILPKEGVYATSVREKSQWLAEPRKAKVPLTAWPAFYSPTAQLALRPKCKTPAFRDVSWHCMLSRLATRSLTLVNMLPLLSKS